MRKYLLSFVLMSLSVGLFTQQSYGGIVTNNNILGYDSQNRLTSWQGGSATYADNGNFQTKSGVETYTYDPVRTANNQRKT